MSILLVSVGWIIWASLVFGTFSLCFCCRKWVQGGIPFSMTTAIQAFFFFVLALTFLFIPLSKLHILWMAPVLFLMAQYLALTKVPIISPIVFALSTIFMNLLLIGTRKSEKVTILRIFDIYQQLKLQQPSLIEDQIMQETMRSYYRSTSLEDSQIESILQWTFGEGSLTEDSLIREVKKIKNLKDLTQRILLHENPIIGNDHKSHIKRFEERKKMIDEVYDKYFK